MDTNNIFWNFNKSMNRIILFLAIILLLPLRTDSDVLSGCATDNPNIISFKTTGSTIDCDIVVSSATDIVWNINGVNYTVADPGLINFGSSATRYHTLYVRDWSKVTSFDSHDVTTFAINIDQFAYHAKAFQQGTFDIGEASGSTGDLANAPRVTNNFSCSNCPLITGDLANAPRVTSIFYVYSCPLITGDLANAPRVTSYFSCSSCPLIIGDLANAPRVTSYFSCSSCPLIIGDIKDSPLVTGNFSIYSTGINQYTATSWPCPTGNSKTLYLHNLGLDQTEVDNILIHNAARTNTGCTLNLTGNAVPSAAGLAARTTLIGRGWTVSVAS